MAGPALSSTSFRLATLPLDPVVQAAQDRQAKWYEQYRLQRRNEAEEAAAACLFKPDSAPLNLLGGYCFANAPDIDADLVKTIERTEARLEPDASVLPPDADPWALPDFLVRS